MILLCGLALLLALTDVIDAQADMNRVSYSELCISTPSVRMLEENESLVYPLLIVNGTAQPLNTLNTHTQTHQSHIQIAFTYMAKDYIIKLQLNGQIRTKKYYSSDESSANDGTKDFQSENSCYYQGVFDKPEHADDFVTISTCQGLRGSLRIDGKPLSVWPLISKDHSNLCWPHLITTLETEDIGTCNNAVSHWEGLNRLHSVEYYKQLSKASAPSDQVSNSDASWVERNLEQKHLKLGLVVDNILSAHFLHNTSNIRDYLLDCTNIIDLFYQRMNIRVSLVYDNIWSVNDDIDISQSVKANLNNFLRYAVQRSTSRPYDVLYLLSGREFENKSAGLSIPTSICTDRSVAVVSAAHLTRNPHKLASVVAHVIGHNIGLEHDDALGCACNSNSGQCIMGDQTGKEIPSLFSSCSIDRLRLLTKVKLGQCLSTQPTTNIYSQKCGNGIIERGEQCDCGPRMSCQQSDPCCDPSTCLLKSWAVCRTGACCESCRPKSTTTLCRTAGNDCDAPEYCDGIGGECPTDASIQDGQPCDNSRGFCYQGLCPTRTGQCQPLWGANSTSSPDACYSLQNTEGSVLGHCGNAPDGGYRRCADRDIFCGLLQCDGGASKSIIDSLEYRKTSTNEHSGGQIEITCKVVSSRDSSVLYQIGMVSDGTKCAESSLCQGHRCVHVDTLRAHGCPISTVTNITCSGHGRCTTDRRCSCYYGFTGSTCDTAIPTLRAQTLASAPYVTVEGVDERRTLAKGALAAVIITPLILVLLAGIAVISYRKNQACFTKTKSHPQAVSSTPNASISAIEASTGLSYQASYHYGYSNRRKRRHRRQRGSSLSSSSEDGSASEEEESLPCVVYEVPVPGDHIKGILKKPSLSRLRNSSSECNSQCSCNQSSSSSLSVELEERETAIVDRIPVPEDTHPLPAHSPAVLAYNADINVPDRRYSSAQHDSNSDSAIDLPTGDSSPPSVTESSFTHTPSNNITKQALTSSCITYLQPIADKNDFSQNCENVETSTLDISHAEASEESINSSTHLISQHVGTSQESPRSMVSMNISQLGDESLDHNFSTYSIRPVNGPMRTFQPDSSPINCRNGFKALDVREPLISNKT